MPSLTDYGPRKYAALHLLISRWLRGVQGGAAQYVYVTLGGTELRDIRCVRFMDPALVTKVVSFEEDKERHKIASMRADELRLTGLDIELVHGDFFSYKRKLDIPHIFFLDLPGICAYGDYATKFGALFQNEVIREGDLLIITSALGRDLGVEKIKAAFRGELSVLGIDESAKVRQIYRSAHPSFTLYKSLNKRGLESELRIRCFGCIKYRDTYPMGLYGYAIEHGATDLARLVRDQTILYFDMNEMRSCSDADF